MIPHNTTAGYAAAQYPGGNTPQTGIGSFSHRSEEPHSLAALTNALQHVSHKWFAIGVQLGVGSGILDRINSENRGDCRACMTKALQQWMQGPSCNISDLIGALSRHSVGERRLALKIETDFAKGVFTTRTVSPPPSAQPVSQDSVWAPLWQREIASLRCMCQKMQGENATLNAQVQDLHSKNAQLERQVCALENTVESLSGDKRYLQAELRRLQPDQQQPGTGTGGTAGDTLGAFKSEIEALENIELDADKQMGPIMNALHLCTHLWKSIGEKLGLHDGTLQAINMTSSANVSSCLSQVIYDWWASSSSANLATLARATLEAIGNENHSEQQQALRGLKNYLCPS